jgi:FlaA1/EpsC-like NDP-sugar epimerase
MVVTGILVGVQLVQPGNYDIPIGLLILISILALFGFMVARYHLRLITGLASKWLQLRGEATHLGENVLIIGAGEMAQLTVRMLRQNNLENSFTIIGTVDDDPKKQGLRINGCKVLGTIQDLPWLIRDKNIGAILFSIGKINIDRRQEILNICHQTGVRLVLIPNILQLLSACLISPSRSFNKGLISQDWDGAVPIQVIMGWLTELESLTQPDNEALIIRLNSIRDALATEIIREKQ